MDVTGGSRYTGGLVGRAYESNITNCYSTGNVSGSGFNIICVGGLLGEVNESSITDCYSSCVVSGESSIGGLVGDMSYSSVAASFSAGTVSGTNFRIGGLVGNTWQSSITSSYNTGVVSGGNDVGGLLGYADDETIITFCYSTGVVSGDGSVGGLVGESAYPSTISNCFNAGAVSGSGGVGGLVGSAYDNMRNCYSTGKVSGIGDSVGGLVGSTYGSITNSYSTGAVSGEDKVGGLLGYARGDSSITSGYSTGAVSGHDYVGGLVGNAYRDSSITSSYSAGAVSGHDYVGGLVGDADIGSTITSSYWDKEISGQTVSAGGRGRTTAAMMQQATFVGWDFTTVWGICENVYYPYLQFHPADNRVVVTIKAAASPSDLPVTFNVNFRLPVTGFDSTDVDFSGGSMMVTAYTVTNTGDNRNYTVKVTEASGTGMIVLAVPESICSAATVCGISANVSAIATVPVWIEINDVDELQIIGNTPDYSLSYAYRLANNIDASSTSEWNSGVGFIPIAPDTDSETNGYQGTPFSGIFDGQGYVITGLNINRPLENYVGIFGDTLGATIRNVALENIDVSGNSLVGGLVGRAYDYTSIANCYSTGVVSGTEDYVGGLAGYASHKSSIMTSYSTCDVSSEEDYVGGLAGYSYESTIMNCYSMGTVCGGRHVGGLVGYSYESTITNCYSTGDVSGNTWIGGLVGTDYSNLAIRSYWDIESSGQTVSDGGVGKTTTEMMQQATFVNWDYVTVWDICEDGSYPFFQGNLTPFPIKATINVAASQADPTNTLPIVFDVVFSRPVTGFDTDDGDDVDVDFSGSTTAVTIYTVTNSGDNMHYTVEVTGIEGDGIIVANIPSAVIIDACFAMSNPASTSTNNSVTYDITPPDIVIGPPSQAIVSQGDYVDFTVDYTGEESSWLTENNITLDVTGDVTAMVTVVSAKDNSYIVTLSDITGIGTLGFTIVAGTAIDAAGNFAAAASAPVLVTAEPDVPVHALPFVVLLLGAGVAALGIRRRTK